MGNREALLEAAITALQDKGYAATTAREITGRAGVSLGAIGYHFTSTQDLLDQALAEGVRRWFEPLIGLLRQPGWAPTLGQLGPVLDLLLQSLDSHRPLVIAYFEALLRAERSPTLRTALAADFQALRTALADGIAASIGQQDPNTSPDPEVTASLIMATFDGLIVQWLLDPDRLPSGPRITQTVQRTAHLI
jgi:AcrR family transcriptional regulator